MSCLSIVVSWEMSVKFLQTIIKGDNYVRKVSYLSYQFYAGFEIIVDYLGVVNIWLDCVRCESWILVFGVGEVEYFEMITEKYQSWNVTDLSFIFGVRVEFV